MGIGLPRILFAVRGKTYEKVFDLLRRVLQDAAKPDLPRVLGEEPGMKVPADEQDDRPPRPFREFLLHRDDLVDALAVGDDKGPGLTQVPMARDVVDVVPLKDPGDLQLIVPVRQELSRMSRSSLAGTS
ncbi:MAG: hypothetical protein LKE85_09275 [Lachnospiraceae bacterium]|nr:hypothetical protein [Lachnospiraceae bacterium]